LTLDNVNIEHECQLVCCDASLKQRSKLETLGLVPGERVKVIQKTGAGLIVEVKKSRLAIAYDLARLLSVEPLQKA